MPPKRPFYGNITTATNRCAINPSGDIIYTVLTHGDNVYR